MDASDPTPDAVLEEAERAAALAFAQRVREALGDDGKNMDVSRYAERLAATERKLGLAHFLDRNAADVAARIAFTVAVEAFRAGRAAAIGKARARDDRRARILAAEPVVKAELRARYPRQPLTKGRLYGEIADRTKTSPHTVRRILANR